MRAFAEENKSWLPDYALYIILKEANIGAEWYDWADEDLKLHRPEAVAKAMKEQAETVLFMEFIQYTFFEQWKKIKKYANSKGVEIIGDLPMYVARNRFIYVVWRCDRLLLCSDGYSFDGRRRTG